MPQVAATLAAVLTSFSVELISESVFNGIIVSMLVTSILGLMMTTTKVFLCLRLIINLCQTSTPSLL
ncbi:MAG: hypothetical protein F6K25_04605 [Okeania sp. SIO2G4]|uniref:hypothetical protein n=1 Tax=unclassified Okeania TaxID=2634635 RepID=UPI0013BC0610|nr:MULTISPECIES: hypothetical protein [unclassified Okeania]NEP46722.1 hypothetical protein [Okeania sp. SIO2H7]NEP71526.1 hypothetical protein [Okeania sp. SIO2G5]NEP96024.1 hypothetical protein [Okeania sp. SIO2F5]NEQ90048.1 hypothetical protein [Okeania sp. SIO2G4]